jgi:hypothetical protein
MAKKDREQQPILAEVGGSGTNRWGGYIHDEWLRDLQGARGRRMYREMMDNEAIIAASMSIFNSLLKQTPVRVDPASDSPSAKAAAEFVDECLHDLEGGIGGVITSGLTMIGYGFAVLEKVYKIRRGPDYPQMFRSKHTDGRWGWRKFGLRKADSIDRWDFCEETDELRGCYQITPHDGKERFIQRDKFLLMRTRSSTDNPEGYSLLRPAYQSYYHAKNMRFVEAVGVERNLAGLPVLEVPPNIMHPSAGAEAAAVRAKAEKYVRGIRRDSQDGLVLPAEIGPEGKPTGWKFRLETGGGNKPADVDPVVKRYESRMAMIFMSGFMLLGQDKVGSYAMSESGTDLLVVGLASILETILDTISDDAIPELCQLNGIRPEDYPRLGHGDIKAPNLAALAAFLQAMSGVGLMTPDDGAEQWARDLVGMPEAIGEAQRDDAPAGDDVTPDMLGDAESEPEPGGEDIQQQVLNGAQVQSLQGIVQSVASGDLPRDAAVGIISLAFQLDPVAAERMLGSAGTAAFSPPRKDPEPAFPGQSE